MRRWLVGILLAAATSALAAPTDNAELQAIYAEDQADRHNWNPDINTRDIAHRKRVDELLANRAAHTAADFFAAAMVFQHGDKPEDIDRAHELALQAIKLDPQIDHGRWLVAATEDRALMYRGKPQRFGTQFNNHDGKWTLWKYDPKTTDEERKQWGVPTLAEQKAREVEMNQPQQPPPGWKPPKQ